MITADFKILGTSDLMQVPSQKAEGGMMLKKFIRLQEFAGSSRQDAPDRIGNAIIATIIGASAQSSFTPGEMVRCALRFTIREYQGSWYQDITVVEIFKLSNNR